MWRVQRPTQGTNAADASREGKLRQSSREADEQSRATGFRAGGAKAGDQERGSAKHAPDTEPVRLTQALDAYGKQHAAQRLT